jgi:prevent-host-death family protein
MEMSVREAKARFSEALAAAERGETVTVTKHGKVVAEIRPPAARKNPIDLAAGAAFLKRRGLDKITGDLPDYFDDTAYSRKVLGLDD